MRHCMLKAPRLSAATTSDSNFIGRVAARARSTIAGNFDGGVTFADFVDIPYMQSDSTAMSSLDDFFEIHAKALHRFAYGLCGDSHLAHDLVAETFVRALLSSATIDTETVQGYLFTIARRLYLKEWHRRQRHVELDDVHADSKPNPEQQLIVRQELERTLQALQSLPEIDRSALLMRAEDAMPYEEIARVLQISLSSAKVKVSRARLKLARSLKGG